MKVDKNNLLFAWLFGALSLTIMFVGWAFITGDISSGSGIFVKRMFAIAIYSFEMGAVWQTMYGILVFLALRRFNIINAWTAVVAYMLPVFIFNLITADTFNDMIDTVPWVIYATVMALVSWFFASGVWRRLRILEEKS